MFNNKIVQRCILALCMLVASTLMVAFAIIVVCALVAFLLNVIYVLVYIIVIIASVTLSVLMVSLLVVDIMAIFKGDPKKIVSTFYIGCYFRRHATRVVNFIKDYRISEYAFVCYAKTKGCACRLKNFLCHLYGNACSYCRATNNESGKSDVTVKKTKVDTSDSSPKNLKSDLMDI